MSEPEIKFIHNRGTVEVPYGFVYVDDTRVGFNQDAAWPTYEWNSSEEQVIAAAQALTAEFGWDFDAEYYYLEEV